MSVGNEKYYESDQCKWECRPDDPLAVVDPQLRVIGLSALRIADASVMPTITSGPPTPPP